MEGCFLPFHPSALVLYFQMVMVVMEDCLFESCCHCALVPHCLVALMVLHDSFSKLFDLSTEILCL